MSAFCFTPWHQGKDYIPPDLKHWQHYKTQQHDPILFFIKT